MSLCATLCSLFMGLQPDFVAGFEVFAGSLLQVHEGSLLEADSEVFEGRLFSATVGAVITPGIHESLGYFDWVIHCRGPDFE